MYETVKIIHILAWTSWMAGLFYLPRIFVYHAESATPGDATSATFNVMQRKLFRLIMSPAMMVTWVTGLILAAMLWSGVASEPWFWIKVASVVAMTAFHVACGRWMRVFETGGNTHPGRFFRMMNEVPTVIFVIIVIMVIARPF